MFLQLPVRTLLFLAIALYCFISLDRLASAASGIPAGKNQHLIFGKGTPQELEVYKIYGRTDGPTVMLLGGIHGNEPGAYLSADLYADVKLKRGNLIIVPRANFHSIIKNQRGNGSDMNRKFAGTLPNDPEKSIVDILKSLMAESDVLITLHDGSGFFRPEWMSLALNPHRYGQSIIADAAAHTVSANGKTLPLQQYAQYVLQKVNKEISDPRHAFRFLNMRTASENSLYKEHRKSATYYALMELGIPAFCIETSHDLPDLTSKVYQHNLVINAFLNLFGVEFEQPGTALGTPTLSYLIVSVNKTLPLAIPNGQTLLVAPGAEVEITDVRANYERGIVVAVQGLDTFNPLRKPFTVKQKTTVSVRKDTFLMGQIDIAPLPQGEFFPRIAGNSRIVPLYEPTPASLPPDLPSKTLMAGFSLASESGRQAADAPNAQSGASSDAAPAPAGVIAEFLLEVDGHSVAVKP
ncbi:MAG: M14/M99 family metallopeptidase, partial [Desulfovibrionaceae bacterium]|nr:M14/M99 family metallopeptidase [Desulfovibrionaceae bacterium]